MSQSTRHRLRHRVPVRLRHNWRLVALCAAFLAACWGVFGSGTIRPYATTSQNAVADTVTFDIAGTKDLFDTSVPHEVKLAFRDESYQDMLTEYFDDGEKKYVEADLTIDGTTIPSVGIRLKGNSTLSSLTWKGQRRTGGDPGGGRPQEGARPPEGFQAPGGFQPPGGGQPQGNGAPRLGGGFGGIGAALKAEEPENLPWLISFDEFVAGRRYQSHSQVAVRPAAGQSSTLLNEALGISMVGAAGEPTQRYAYGSFTVNGRSSGPRLLVEYLDEGYAEDLGGGVLYKSLASGSFTYKGEDQTKYAEDFKQINKIGGSDLQPVIDLIKWVEQSSDQEFAAGLPDRVDMESFARYLALQNLMVNFDDMSGPGRNYYLWYDLDTGKLQVITWDLNFAFSGDATAGPSDTISMGAGRGRPQQGGPPQGQAQQSFPAPNDGGQGRAGGPRVGHALKEKFLKAPAFEKVYEQQYRDLYQKLLADGSAGKLLDDIVRSYKLNAGADAAKVDAEAASLHTTLKTRAASLRSDKMISGA